MALTNNLVTDPKDFPALAEAMSQRQPGDRLRLTVEVVVVENLPARFCYDVEEVELAGVGSTGPEAEVEEEDDGEPSPLAASVMGVMAKKKK